MTLTQYVEHGHLAEGVFVLDQADESIVAPANRSRIIERERDGHWEPGAWFVFPSHPHDPALEEYLTRIRWVGEQQYRQPHNHNQAVAALNIRRSIGVDRRVDWHYFETRPPRVSQRYDINVKDGNNLHLTVWSGIPFLHVRSGHVTVDFRSRWGNSITIHEGASAHVVVPSADTKVTIHNEGGTLTMDVPEGKNRVRCYEKSNHQGNPL